MKRANKDIHKSSLRNEQYASHISTRLWSETPSSDNPYIAEDCRCHGYELFDLISKRSFTDVIYLLFQGELPSKEQEQILQALMIGLINPGPRHPATRAAMNAGIGKTDPAHILPISLLAIGGTHLGGSEVAVSMRFLTKSYRKDPHVIAQGLIDNPRPSTDTDWHIAPGFGTRFNGIDIIPKKLGLTISRMPQCGNVVQWGNAFADILEQNCGCSWLSTGIAAAVLADLGFHPRAGAGLFQLISAPGLLAHGLEMSNKPITSMPFIDDDHYVIEK